jgi:DNA-binding HxlR family transcriptional regulator
MSGGTRFLPAVRPLAYAVRMAQRRSSAAGVARSRPVSAARFPTPEAAAHAVEEALRLIKGRWKLLILFHLFGGQVRRFSALERAIPGVSQKMLTQQLRQLEEAGLVRRVIYPEVPPRVEYALTDRGQALCPVLDSLLQWLPDNLARPSVDGPGAHDGSMASLRRPSRVEPW